MAQERQTKTPVYYVNFIKLLTGIFLILIAGLLAYSIISIWPIDSTNGEWDKNANLFGIDFDIDSEIRLIVIVMLGGTLGSFVHIATSFASYAGNNKFKVSWIWWYILRPFIGMALALILYFVTRGGLLSVDSGVDNVNLYGVTAVAGLTGMFSKQASDKLEEIFNNLFRTKKDIGDNLRDDKLKDNPTPTDE